MRGRVARRIDAGPVPGDWAEQVAGEALPFALGGRARCARELHDSVSQTLIGLQLTAQAAADLWECQPAQARAALETVRALAAGAATELRAVLLDLHDAVLERQVLVTALEAYCAVVRERSRPARDAARRRAGPRHSGRDVGAEQAAARGARGGGLSPGAGGPGQRGQVRRATHARVTLVLDSTLRVWVEDDGVGFGAPASAFSYGLVGMRERAEAVGGLLRLDNGPAGGAGDRRAPQRPRSSRPYVVGSTTGHSSLKAVRARVAVPMPLCASFPVIQSV
jgi:hypothetical protein